MNQHLFWMFFLDTELIIAVSVAFCFTVILTSAKLRHPSQSHFLFADSSTLLPFFPNHHFCVSGYLPFYYSKQQQKQTNSWQKASDAGEKEVQSTH